MGEFFMMLALTAGALGSSAAADASAPTLAHVGRAVAPGWCAGTAAQVLWCGAFRPSVCGPKMLWIPAALLAATAAGLGTAHRALRSLPGGRALPPLTDALVRWPIVLHFGWITSASLVNWNNWLAHRGTAVSIKAFAACASAVLALGAAAFVYATTGDALFAFVVCWALSAVASDGAKDARGKVGAGTLSRVRSVVATCAAVAFAGLLAKIGE